MIFAQPKSVAKTLLKLFVKMDLVKILVTNAFNHQY